MSFTVFPAAASARSPATAASSDASTWLILRSFIPVLVVIHSSEVSTSCSRSWLVRTLGGMHLPQPVISAFRISISSVSFHGTESIQHRRNVLDGRDQVHLGAGHRLPGQPCGDVTRPDVNEGVDASGRHVFE